VLPLWNFIGMPESVPISSRAPLSRSCWNLRCRVGLRGLLEVADALGMLQRLLDVVDDRRRQAHVPVAAVDELVVLHRVREVVEPLDGRRPEQRARGHVAGALAQGRDHVRRVFGRCRQAGVLEAVHAGLQAAADLFRPVRVRDHR
jgi:hypothetical protein